MQSGPGDATEVTWPISDVRRGGESMSTNSSLENTAGHSALRDAARRFGLKPARAHFLFLRHGRTAGNIGRIYQHPDIPLATEGFTDADLAANALKSVPFDIIHASDMSRAWLTAGRVAALTGRPVHVHRALRERYFGDFIGTSSVGLDWRIDPPNGETMQEFIERTLTGVHQMLDTRSVPLLVSHGGVLRVLCGALDLDLPIELTVNGLPLAFDQEGTGWKVTPLMQVTPAEQLGAA
jgi:broad specificity phosphatase PhoE